ncbi:MAG: TIGR00269 family protein [Candidatus Aenigmarchaeota archaeon]|nr:TIGR00269 family protein [Candidatus Aenigmarchaeota archaeon]
MDSVILKWDATQHSKNAAGHCACGTKGIYYRRWEGKYYCASCFARQVETRFRKTVSANKLVRKGERVAVALSGGKDSAALLYLLNELRKHMPFTLVAVSADEGITGYRDASLEKAEELTKMLGVEHHTASFAEAFAVTTDDIEKKHCTYCGVFRRYLLNKKAHELGADKLAVGHNLDDEAQSILMNFFRGDIARFHRLGAKPASGGDGFVPRIKPLRDIPEKETALYALVRNLPFSGSECPHSFDNLRRDVQAMVNGLEAKYPGTKMQIVSFYDRLKPSLTAARKEAIAHCAQCGEPSSGGVCKACELLGKVRSAKFL